MKQPLLLLAMFAIGNYVMVTSCTKPGTTPNPNPSPQGTVTTLAGPSFPLPSGGGASASFNQPFGVAVDDTGNIYVADYDNNLIRKISAAGVVSILAGTGKQGSTNGAALQASFDLPSGVAVDKSGNIYVADLANSMIRMITPSGTVSTLAGGGAGSSTNGVGSAASFNGPTGIAVDIVGNVFVADAGNNLIRKISPSGVVSTYAGNGNSGFVNDINSAAEFNNPTGVAVDAHDNVYVADAKNNMIRLISVTGYTETWAGSGTAAGSLDGLGIKASFSYPVGIAMDVAGNLYVTEFGNSDIRLVGQNGQVSTLAGNGAAGSANGVGAAASFKQPFGIAVDTHGNIYVADQGNNLIRMITQTP